MALSIPASKIVFRVGTIAVNAVVLSIHAKGMFAVVKDLMNEGTEGIVNLRNFYSWFVPKGDTSAEAPASKESSAAFWLQERVNSTVTVAAAGMKEALRGKLLKAYERSGLGIFFEVQTDEGIETFQWSNVLFVRHRIVAAKPVSKARREVTSTSDTGDLTEEIQAQDGSQTIIGGAGN